MKSLFDRMKEPELIDAFLEHQRLRSFSDFDFESKRAYVTSERYLSDVERISSGDYFLKVPVKKTIPKSLSDKKRTVYCVGGDDKIFLQVMSFALHDFDDRFPDAVYSSMIGKSFKKYINILKSNRKLKDMYAVKVDISGYGSSVDSSTLIEMLRDFFADDPAAFEFFRWLLERRLFYEEGQLTEGDTSAIPGIPIHSFFTNLYLLDMDIEVEEKCTAYCRYSDDILAFSEDRESAEALMAYFRGIIEGRKLRINEKKTAIYEPHSRIEHMGISYEDGRIDISDYSLYKLKRKMRIRAKRLRRQVEDGRLSPEAGAKSLIRLNHQTFFGRPNSHELSWSRWLFPILTETSGLHELELYFQRCIRYVMTGKWSDSGYRIKYKELKALGYTSLVREYYRS